MTDRSSDVSLSFNQEAGLLLEWAGRQAPFQLVRGFAVEEGFDETALREALNELLRRHQILSMGFTRVLMQGQPLRAVPFRPRLHDVRDFPLRVVSVDEGREVDEAQFERIVADETRRSFELACPPLIHATLFTSRAKRRLLTLAIHHLIADTWSADVIARELKLLCRSRLDGQEPALPPAAACYADFVRDQRQQWEAGAMEASVVYWMDRWRRYGGAQLTFSDVGAAPPRYGRTSVAGYQMVVVDQERSAVIRDAARRRGVSTYMMFLAGFAAALHWQTGKGPLAIWAHFANRMRVRYEDVVGWFANSHLLGLDCSPDLSLQQLLQQVRAVVLEAMRHQAIPVVQVWRRLDAIAPGTALRLLPAMWVSFDYVADRAGRLAERPFASVTLPPVGMVPGMQCMVVEREAKLTVMLMYSAERIDAERAGGLVEDIMAAVDALVEDDPSAPLASVARAHVRRVASKET